MSILQCKKWPTCLFGTGQPYTLQKFLKLINPTCSFNLHPLSGHKSNKGGDIFAILRYVYSFSFFPSSMVDLLVPNYLVELLGTLCGYNSEIAYCSDAWLGTFQNDISQSGSYNNFI